MKRKIAQEVVAEKALISTQYVRNTMKMKNSLPKRLQMVFPKDIGIVFLKNRIVCGTDYINIQIIILIILLITIYHQ